VIPDVEILVLALAGLVYLIPSVITRIEASKTLRRTVTTLLVTFALLTVVVNAINREEEEHTKEELRKTIAAQSKRLDEVSTSNRQILTFFAFKKNMNEAERRQNIEKALRNEFILSHDPTDPDVLSGIQMPPESWMNQRLQELGETWKFAAKTPAGLLKRKTEAAHSP
jgi:cell division protein FtsB